MTIDRKFIERMLRALEDMAERHTPVGAMTSFDMSAVATRLDCGTAGCLAGLACALDKMAPEEWGMVTAGALMRLTSEQGSALFCPMGTAFYSREPREGAVMLRWLLEHPRASENAILAEWDRVVPNFPEEVW